MAVVREAGGDDIPRIIDMIEDLRAAVAGPITVDRIWTAKTIAGLMTDPRGAVWVSSGGFIAGSLRPTVISPALIACEHGWWASDGTGLRLLRV
ncbi:hypothetical protein, partial [Paracoccus sp. (in: a-proteobacteria)]|uniref:hypothetical protein n=1 Tax=Paracoccus sp. TaxID=267 RepID=UPI00289B97D0